MHSKPITTIAKHIVPKSQEDGFKDWVRGIDETCQRFVGYQGLEHIHSLGDSDMEHFCIFRFETEGNLDLWMQSEARKCWLDDERSCSASVYTARPYQSLDFWFESAERPGAVTSDSKMAIVTFLVIWPMVHYIPPLLDALVSVKWLIEPMSVAVIVVLMTYFVMPLVTRLLARWLFRK